MNKKLIIGIIIGAIIGIGILGALYFLLFTPKDDSTNPAINIFNSFFPNNTTVEDPNTPSDPIDFNFAATTTPSGEAVIPKLRLISGDWIAGYTSYDRASTTSATSSFATTSRVAFTETVIRFIERARGHVYETTERTLDNSKISFTTQPKIEKAYFGDKDKIVTRRFNSETGEVETFVGSLIPLTPTSTDSFELKGTNLTPNITDVAVFGNKMFSLYSTASGASGYVTSPLLGKDSLMFKSPLSYWLPEFVNQNFLLLTSKPSGVHDGNAFLYNLNERKLSKLVGPSKGLLVSISNDLERVLYTESTASQFNTFYKNIKNDIVLGLQSRTFPEKCTWSSNPNIIYCAVPENIPAGKYPDDWYKGLVSFTDKIVRIDLDKNSETTLISLRNESGRQIDAINLSLDKRERYIYFINKVDGSLWSFDMR